MIAKISRNKNICLLSSVPITLRSFYGNLIRQLKADNFTVTLIASDLPELHELKKEFGCTIFPVQISRRISPFQDIRTIYKLWRHFRLKRYEIIHAHTPKGGFVGMVASSFAHVTNRIYTVHGLLLETSRGPRRWLLWSAEALACKLATTVLAVSPSLKQKIQEEKLCVEGKIQVLGKGSACGVNLTTFNPTRNWMAEGQEIRGKYGIPKEATVIGFVGRIVPDKGIRTLVDAFERLQHKVPESYLLLVGEFDNARETLDAETMSIIEKNSHIICNGQFIDNVLPFYSAMDMVTLPSKREGFGLTLLEAAAMELPTIATKVTGCVDAVVDNITGLLVEVDSIPQLYDAMLLLAQNPKLRRKLGQQGRQRTMETYSSELLVNEHIKLYKSLLAQRDKHAYSLAC